MKKTFLSLALLIANFAIGQSSTIFKGLETPILVLLPIERMVEFDGHILDNKKAKDPIKFKATLDGVEIYDSKRKYNYRKCEKPNCGIIHLIEKFSGTVFYPTNKVQLLSN